MSEAFTRAVAVLIAKMRHWPGLLWRLEGRLKGVEFEGRCEFLGRPLITRAANSRLVIGDGVRIYSSTRCNTLACFQPCVLRALSPGSRLILGRRVGLSAAVVCAGSSIEIGEGTILGAGAMVVDNDFHIPEGEWGWSNTENVVGEISRPVKIGRGVFIGARAIVLKGVTIGDRAVVGAAAVVTKDVPAGCVAVGNPARCHEPRRRS